MMTKTKMKPTWKCGKPMCAFPDGIFNRNNWNCATMNALRDIAEKLGTCQRNDQNAGSIGYVPFVDAEYETVSGKWSGNGYIVMTWYKNRGRTGNAIVMWDNEPIQELTLGLAIEVIKQYRGVWD